MKKIKVTSLAHSEALSGVLLIISFILAVAASNIPFFESLYKRFVFLPFSFGLGQYVYTSPLISLVNDGLMTLFFLLIGLELKYHLVLGEFADRKKLILPTFAAVGGIVVPVLIYMCCNYNSPETQKGWAIPIATDTAFMLGILSFFKNKISSQLRAFIIGFSLIDDAIALIILAVFYSKTPSIMAIGVSVVLLGILIGLNRLKITNGFPYLVTGLLLWVAMVEAGVHGTLCGVILALTIPVRVNDKVNPFFNRLENVIRPIVFVFILPLFAFINSGINFNDFPKEIIFDPIMIGIFLGLFLGKQLGIFSFSYLAVKKNICALPEHVAWKRFYAIAVLGGIGFTLSLFIGDLTFELVAPNDAMRLGVILGSLLSAVLGVFLLIFSSRGPVDERS